MSTYPLNLLQKNRNMSYFDKILDKRNLDKCPLPLWKLKITDEEYEELRTVLEKRTHIIGTNDVFNGFQRECALFYAEYWRREYCEGAHDTAEVYKTLKSTIHSRNFTEIFYEAAIKGAKYLGIQIYQGKRTEVMDSLLYQGGLPMRSVTDGDRNGVWNKFTHGLVNRHIDFDNQKLGIVATESNSMRQYCDQLVDAIEAEQYMLLPFYCDNEDNSWFVYLKNLAKQERHKRRQLRPFSLDWEFTLDQNACKITVKYLVKGLQNLPGAFIEEQNLQNFKFFTTQVRVNGKAIDSFDYINFYSRYAVVSKHPYKDGENVAFYINDAPEPHLSDELDMSVPHLVYRNERGAFVLGNRLGKVESAIIYPTSWKLNNKDLVEETYTWNDGSYKVAIIPEKYIDPIVLIGEDGTLELSSNARLVWTEVRGCSVNNHDVVEQLYDASSLHFFICYDGDDGVKSYKANEMEYKGSRQSSWQQTIPYGRISARAKDASGRFVTPLRLINIGSKDDLVVFYTSETEDTCYIKVLWKHGKVICENGTKGVNEQWEVKKEDCENNKILFTLVPEDNPNNQFSIHIRAPFKEFSILDVDDKPVKSNSWVPYVDIDKYKYHIVGHYIKQYSYGNVVRELQENADKLWIVENGKRMKSIPFEGSLTTLFDSREVIRAMLDQTSENMLNAAVEIRFLTTKGEELILEVKDSPYRTSNFANRIYINSKDRQVINYHGALKLLKLDEPQHEPYTLLPDEENGFTVPEEVYSWGNIIVAGRSRGRICPGLMNMTQELTGEKRLNIRAEAINKINEEIANSKLGDGFWTRALGWYDRIQKDDIPASSLIEFVCISQNPVALLCLTFQLYAQSTDEDSAETLANQLMTLSNDLAFQWFWLRDYIHRAMFYMQPMIDSFDNEVIRSIYVLWAMTKDAPTQYLRRSKIPDYLMTCLSEKLTAYQEWMEKLAIESLQEKYDDKSDELIESISKDIAKGNKVLHIEDNESLYVDTKQDRSWKYSPFFDQYAEKRYCPENEHWFWKRVNVMTAHLKGEVNLFEQADGIKRSIIFCSKSCNRKFIIELNNKLAKQ